MEPADQGDVCSGSRLCENVHGQRMRRIVFSIGFSRQWSPALLVFKSTKSRWNFYKKILRGSFHTAWVKRRNTHPEEMFSALHLKADSSQTSRHDCFVSCVDGSELARAFFTFCSIGRCSHVFGLLMRLT